MSMTDSTTTETKHVIGLLLGTETDWPNAFEALVRRAGGVTDGTGTRHLYDVERITIEPFDLRQQPSYDLVIDRLAYWYYHPARVAEEGRADGRDLSAQLAVHVPGDGEARGVLRDDATRPEGPGDSARAVQEPGRPRQVRLHRRALQRAVRPRRGRRARRLPAVHEAVRRGRLAWRVAHPRMRTSCTGPTTSPARC